MPALGENRTQSAGETDQKQQIIFHGQWKVWLCTEMLSPAFDKIHWQ